MKMLTLLGIVLSLLVLAACSSEDVSVGGITDSGGAASSTPDPLSGTWSGDWGPSESHRNPVTLELKWDGTNLGGTVNPGPNSVPLTKAAFTPDTGTVTMEASAPGRGAEKVDFIIEGKLTDGVMTGTWVHDDKKGDFKVARS